MKGLTATANLADRFLLLFVIAVAAAGIGLPGPGRVVSAGDGINAALAVLVFATGLSLRLADLAAVRTAWRRITVVLVVSTAALPGLAWAASRLISDPVLRSGMQTVGVAPAEVATVALCVIAGGDAALCAVILAASTLVTVLAAGPVLALSGSAATVPAAGLLGTLLVVVALPLAAGIGLRAAWEPGARADAAIRLVTVVALLVLLWQVASQIRLGAGYLRVVAALAVFLAGSALLGGLLAVRLPIRRTVAVLLPVTMRDFAVAAGIAATAFGPAAAAPLGVYGVFVLVTGAVISQVAARRQRPG